MTASSDVFIRKLETYIALPDDDRAFLTELLSDSSLYEARADVIVEGDNPEHVHVVLEGIACRYKLLPEDKRQIAAFLLPGDFCDLHIFTLKEMDHSIGCIRPSTICAVPRLQVLKMLDRPAIARALVLSNLVDEAILREWIANIGQRNAVQRMAHLFFELFLRMRIVGLVEGRSFRLPISQGDLADALGLSLVHTNKSLQILRRENLISYARGTLNILDVDAIRKRCAFKENYLHLTGAKPFLNIDGTEAV